MENVTDEVVGAGRMSQSREDIEPRGVDRHRISTPQSPHFPEQSGLLT